MDDGHLNCERYVDCHQDFFSHKSLTFKKQLISIFAAASIHFSTLNPSDCRTQKAVT